MPRFRVHYFNRTTGQVRHLDYEGKDGDDCRRFMQASYPHCNVNKVKLLKETDHAATARHIETKSRSA